MDIEIVEDETGLRELYQTVFEDAGFSVNCHACAEDYLTYTKKQIYTPPSIAIITDVRMPGKSGYELIEEVKKTNPKQKFVVITGTPQDGYSKDAKACFYLQKPVKMDKLLAVITLLSSCKMAGNQHLAPACKLINDLDSFDMHDWKCPHQK
ncbi:response regulator [Colwellia piezophila]|uniref:response regulator n=1 Tax=Colwellia piezophila TaxID=211668 RepID=UPI00037AA890|nr:response regulator [Colwellia piezophila]